MIVTARACLVAAILALVASPLRAEDAGQLVLAKDLLASMHAADNFDAVVPAVFAALKPALTRGDAKATKDWDELAPVVASEFSAAKSQLFDDVAQIYAQTFTADELKAFVAFYKTPAGEKLARLTPTLGQQTLAAGQRFGQQVAAKVGERMREELRKRGNTI